MFSFRFDYSRLSLRENITTCLAIKNYLVIDSFFFRHKKLLYNSRFLFDSVISKFFN